MIDLLIAPLGYPFVVRALAAVTMAAAACALVGTFAVLRGMSYIGSALAHSLVPGVAVGYLTSGSSRDRLFWWATGTAVLAALGMSALVRRSRIGEDAAVGIVYSGMLALGIVIISRARSFAVDLVHFLFGNVLSVNGADLIRIGATAAVIVAVVGLFYKELVLITFDRVFAASVRINGRLLTALQYVLMALAIAVSLQTIGIALVVTLMVAPAAAALQVARRFHHAVLTAAAIGVVSGVAGLYLSYYLNVASGAAVALVCVVVFLVIAALARALRAEPDRERHGTADPAT